MSRHRARSRTTAWNTASVLMLLCGNGVSVGEQSSSALDSRSEARREPSALAKEISGTNHNIEKYGKFRHVAKLLQQQRPPTARL